MSVVETNKIDAMGISKDKRSLILMLSDHLDWENEANHLYLLQEKINAYLGFIETKQYEKIYSNKFESYIIDIRSKFAETGNCRKFIEVVNRQIDKYGISIIVSVEGN